MTMNHIPEINDTKMINYYVFESKEESCIKNGKEIKYTRTARVPKSESVCDIVDTLKESGESYLRHRSHVENVGTIFPIIRKSFSGTYIELNFSENIGEKPKYEVQNTLLVSNIRCAWCPIFVTLCHSRTRFRKRCLSFVG